MKKVICCVMVCAMLFLSGCSKDNYTSACKNFAEGNYDEAQLEFKKVSNNYEDASSWKRLFAYSKENDYKIGDLSEDTSFSNLLSELALKGFTINANTEVPKTTRHDVSLGNFSIYSRSDFETLMQNDTFKNAAVSSLKRYAQTMYNTGSVYELVGQLMGEAYADVYNSEAGVIFENLPSIEDYAPQCFEFAKQLYTYADDTENAAKCEERLKESK